MKITIVALFLLTAFTIGCGGGQNNTPAPNFANVAASWKIVLSENQAATVVAAKSASAPVDPKPDRNRDCVDTIGRDPQFNFRRLLWQHGMRLILELVV
jgi:hypothetical protein